MSAAQQDWFTLPPDSVAPVRAAGAPPPGTVLPAHHRGCFACGGDQPDGLHLVAEAGEGPTVTTRATLGAAHEGAPGLAHGGAVAALLDETLGYVLWLLQVPGVTVRLDVQYRRPVPVGAALVGTGRCLGIAGRKVYTAGELRIGDELVAEARGLFVAVGVEHFTRYADPAALAAMAGSARAMVGP